MVFDLSSKFCLACSAMCLLYQMCTLKPLLLIVVLIMLFKYLNLLINKIEHQLFPVVRKPYSNCRDKENYQKRPFVMRAAPKFHLALEIHVKNALKIVVHLPPCSTPKKSIQKGT